MDYTVFAILFCAFMLQLFQLITNDKIKDNIPIKAIQVALIGLGAIFSFLQVRENFNKEKEAKAQINRLEKTNDLLLVITDSTKSFVVETKNLVSATDSIARTILGINKKLDSGNVHLTDVIDSLSLLQDGTVLLSPCEDFIRIDTLSDSLRLYLMIGNSGNTIVSNVNINIWAQNKKNYREQFLISKYRNLFFGIDNKTNCLSIRAKFNKRIDIRDYFIVYKISYTHKKERVKSTKAIIYVWDMDQWQVSPASFIEIPYE